MRSARNFSLGVAATALPLILASCPSFAQVATSAQPLTVEEVIVTAQKREQSLISVPAAVSAMSGAKLTQLNVSTFAEVSKLTPNFSVSYERGENSTPNFTIRGVSGDTLASRLNESSIAVYSDDVFQGDQTALNGQLFDIERVEVLRGPQGTVFGKNTTGGLVNFISAKPTNTLSGYGSFEYGANNKTAIEGAVSGPISDRIRVRLSGRWDRDDGDYVNDYQLAGQDGIPKRLGGTNIWGLRGIVDIDLDSKTMLRLIGSYTDSNSQSVPGRALGYLKPGTTAADFPFTAPDFCTPSQGLAGDCLNSTDIFFGGAPNAGREPGHGITNLPASDTAITERSPSITAVLTHDFGWAKFTSITNYMQNSYHVGFDGDFGLTATANSGLNIIATYENHSSQFSQELRLNGSTSSIDWVGGAYLYLDHKRDDIIVDFVDVGLGAGGGQIPLGFTQRSDGGAKTNSYAVFGQTDAHLSKTVTLTIGGRLTDEVRQLTVATTEFVGGPVEDVINGTLGGVAIGPGIPQTRTDNVNFTGKLALSWMPNPSSNYYISLSSGVKSAGFNTGFSPNNSLAVNVAVAGPVKQETLDDIEVGAKNSFFGGKLSINSAVFYYHFDGKQEDYFTYDGVTSQENYLNVGVARMYGAETEINVRPNQYFDLYFSGGLLDTKITSSTVTVLDAQGQVIPAQGSPLERSPKWTFSTIGAFHLPTAEAGVFTLQAEANGRDKQLYAVGNDPYAYDNTHVFVNLRLIWASPNRKYTAQAYVTNVFNEASESRMITPGLSGANPIAFTGSANTAEGLGRLWGVKVGATF